MQTTEARAIIAAQQEIPVDVVKVAESLGIRVWKSRLPEGISGKLVRDSEHGGESGYSIVVNAEDSLNRVRFTVAHEIGHFLMHRTAFDRSIEDTVLYRSALSDFKEAQANRFAARLLAPEHLLRQEVLAGRTGTSELAARFQVSLQAMRIRLEHFARSVGAL